MPPKGGRKKKALLIGINYTGSKAELAGCHADVENVGRFLNQRGYPAGPKCRLVLRDDLEGKYYPTGVSLVYELQARQSLLQRKHSRWPEDAEEPPRATSAPWRC